MSYDDLEKSRTTTRAVTEAEIAENYRKQAEYEKVTAERAEILKEWQKQRTPLEDWESEIMYERPQVKRQSAHKQQPTMTVEEAQAQAKTELADLGYTEEQMTTPYIELGTITPPNMQQYDPPGGLGGWTGIDYTHAYDGTPVIDAAEKFTVGLDTINKLIGPLLPLVGAFIGGAALVDSVRDSKVKRALPDRVIP